MAKPVNLNRYRKDKARTQDRARADRNAAFHGLTRAQKAAARAEAERAARRHEGLRHEGMRRGDGPAEPGEEGA